MQSFAPEANPRAFRTALGSFATGVCVVTARGADGAPAGITINSFSSVSLDPPLVLWSLAKASSRYATFAAAERFALHVLAADQQAVCDAFVRARTEFPALPWAAAPDGVPLVEGCLARLRCERHAVVDAGDHVVLLARVLHADRQDGAPLVFQGGRYGRFAPEAERHPAPEP